MALLRLLLLVSAVLPLAQCYPFSPPTCYSKVLSMAREATQWASYLKRAYETYYCMAHMPELYVDVHNSCVVSKMRKYITLADGLRQRRCAYTKDVRRLHATLKQLLYIMMHKCHGELAFTSHDCAELWD